MSALQPPPYMGRVKNRADLRRILESSLLTPEPEPEEIDKVEEIERTSIKPKTYVVESNTQLDEMGKNGYELQPSEDPTLWNLYCSTQRGAFYLYLDILNKRYWSIHSTYYAGESDRVVEDITSNNSNRLDSLWLSSESLERLGEDKRGTGFGIKYSNVFASREERPKLSMRYWGEEVANVLNGVKGVSPIHNRISLTSVGINFRTDVGFVKTDIFQNGKITAKSGDSIESHFALIETVKQHYSQIISEIERNYVVRYQYSENYCTLQGTYAVITFGTPISDLQSFTEILISGENPFRIWGVWKPISSNHIRIDGIDLHTKTPIELELMPDEIRIILKDKACGNVVTRLFTNIQSNYDSTCQLKGVNDANLIRAH